MITFDTQPYIDVLPLILVDTSHINEIHLSLSLSLRCTACWQVSLFCFQYANRKVFTPHQHWAYRHVLLPLVDIEPVHKKHLHLETSPILLQLSSFSLVRFLLFLMIKLSMPGWITNDWFPTSYDLLNVVVMIKFVCVTNNFHCAYHTNLFTLRRLIFLTNHDHESVIYH